MPRVGGWLGSGREVALTDSLLPGPIHLLDRKPEGDPGGRELPSAHSHPWRVVRQTHSRLSRPWFTFRASARAFAPPSPMLLLENL